MARPRKHTKESLAASALDLFWRNGFKKTSLDDLVQATGVSRYGIYGDFGNKRGLFTAVFDVYQREVVSPAFAQVEAPGAGLEAIEAYFEHQIRRAEAMGLPGPGCLVANTLNETSAHDKAVLACIRAHNERFRNGFANVIRNVQPKARHVDALADTIVTFTHGLWSSSRMVDNPDELRTAAGQFLELLRLRLAQT